VAEVYFAIPGDLATPTGGYGYDRRVLALLPGRGVDVRYLQLPGSYPFASVPELGEAGYKLRNTPDDAVLFIDGLAYGALTDLVLKDIDRRIVALVHHPLALESGLSDRRRRALHYSETTALARASHVVVTSATTAEILAADYDVPTGKVTVAEPGTDPASRARGSGNGNHMLAVGTISPRKGYGVLVEALSGLPASDWHLTIVGALDRAPDEAASIAALVKAAGLDGRIEFKGVLDDAALEAAFDSADIFVMPSLFEGYGMVLGEAMARGLPIVCTTGGAAARTVPDKAALKVPPGDSAALREAITRVLADAELRARLSEASWAAGQSLPRWDQTADRIATVLRSVMSGA
jgi:glycosyltransferase involved in cell wall biosynthesis